MKTFIKYVVVGAATYVGYEFARSVHHALGNPYERARIKQKYKNIKNELLNKD